MPLAQWSLARREEKGPGGEAETREGGGGSRSVNRKLVLLKTKEMSPRAQNKWTEMRTKKPKIK